MSMRRPPRSSRSPLPVAHALFSTPFGDCGLAWTAQGLAWVQLPERTPAATRARMVAAVASRSLSMDGGDVGYAEPPSWVADAMARLAGHLGGRAEDLLPIPLDMAPVSPFFRRVYEEARAVPRGEVRTYAALAAAAGSPAATRAVGQAMARNPWPVIVPCHRIVGSAGKPGGFSAAGGLDTKARLLALEGTSLIVAVPRLKTWPPAS
jgi:methylated-DNA-[protein]-cysteine S-methyltransferase